MFIKHTIDLKCSTFQQQNSQPLLSFTTSKFETSTSLKMTNSGITYYIKI